MDCFGEFPHVWMCLWVLEGPTYNAAKRWPFVESNHPSKLIKAAVPPDHGLGKELVNFRNTDQ